MKSVIVYYKKTITIDETVLGKKCVCNLNALSLLKECLVYVFCVFWISLHTFMQNDPANETHQHLSNINVTIDIIIIET